MDSAGNAYVTGWTQSINFPTASPLQAAIGGTNDTFVAKLNAPGSALAYSTYLGGDGGDDGRAIAVDSAGNAYVTGYTSSSNFPTTSPLQAANRGALDAFIAKIADVGACTYTISPTNQSFPANSGTGSVAITAPSGCRWIATSNASWLAITSGSSGSGNGTVTYSVAANTTFGSRTGTLMIAGQPFTVTQVGSGFVTAGSAQGVPGGTAHVPVTLTLPSGVTVDTLSFTGSVIPNGAAPMGGVSFQNDPAMPPSTAVCVASAGAFCGGWQNLPVPLSGTVRLGDAVVQVPATAVAGQSYTIQISRASGSLGTTAVSLQPGLNATLTVLAATSYLAGDAFPLHLDLNNDADTDDLGEFGDGALSVLDLIFGLRAVTSVPGFRPPSCSDRFDAVDSFPADTATARGGDGALNTLDLIITLRRVTNVDTSRPQRTPRGLPCPAP